MFCLLLTIFFIAGSAFAAEEVNYVEKDWSDIFSKFSVEGTAVILDQMSDASEIQVHNVERAKKRFSPASTFKIVHSLFALDAGLIKRDGHVFHWDGRKRIVKAWNKDQSLKSAIQNSVVWVFEELAQELGDEKELGYLNKISYGNCKTGKSPFWISGELAISAVEQIGILQLLHRNKLPFEEADQQIVKSVIELYANEEIKVYGKTGWNGKIGWFVGWVEIDNGSVFFALNIDTKSKKDLPAREGILNMILRSKGIEINLAEGPEK